MNFGKTNAPEKLAVGLKFEESALMFCENSSTKTLKSHIESFISQGMAKTHVEKEQQCICHWFQSWSAYQKQDFLQFLLDRAIPQNLETLFGAMGAMNVQDRPPSIFQCQLKLFGEWFSEWTDKERNDLMVWLAATDSVFMEKFNQEMENAKQQRL